MPTAFRPRRELTLTERVLFERLGWFVEVRWVAGLMALVFTTLAWYGFGVRFAALRCVAVVLGMFLYNAFFSLCARALYTAERARQRWILAVAHGQIVCDLAAVAALVHFIGGVESHFIILFVFPVVVASEFFSKRLACAYATLAAVLVNLIGWGEYLVPEAHYSLLVLVPDSPGQYAPLVAPGAAGHPVFVLQVCFATTFAVYATVLVAASIADRLRQREAELEDAYDDLQSLRQIKSNFMRRTSHELRAPVSELQGLMKAAMHRMPPQARGRDLVARAVHRTEHVFDLIDDLLRYSRLRTADAGQRFEPVELAEVVRTTADLLRPRAEEKGLSLQVQNESAVVLGARDNLSDLVTNLISNAIRYTPTGGTVTVQATTAGGEVRLVVADTGIGIPDDELPHVFEEFFRGREAKRTVAHGTGLGMAIVKRVVDMHRGRIDVESRPGHGTRFTVTFPAVPDTANSALAS